MNLPHPTPPPSEAACRPGFPDDARTYARVSWDEKGPDPLDRPELRSPAAMERLKQSGNAHDLADAKSGGPPTAGR